MSGKGNGWTKAERDEPETADVQLLGKLWGAHRTPLSTAQGHACGVGWV